MIYMSLITTDCVLLFPTDQRPVWLFPVTLPFIPLLPLLRGNEAIDQGKSGMERVETGTLHCNCFILLFFFLVLFFIYSFSSSLNVFT